MAKFTIRVDKKTGMTYFPQEIRREGFVGEIEGLPNALTFTLIKPGTKLADVEKSLNIILQDIALRRGQGQEWAQKRKELELRASGEQLLTRHRRHFGGYGVN